MAIPQMYWSETDEPLPIGLLKEYEPDECHIWPWALPKSSKEFRDAARAAGASWHSHGCEWVGVNDGEHKGKGLVQFLFSVHSAGSSVSLLVHGPHPEWRKQ